MNIIWTEHFAENVKYYIHKKKYKKIVSDIDTVAVNLKAGFFVGNKLAGFVLPEGAALYKVRVANTSANVGKAGGFRIIYYVATEDKIYLLTIYSKKDDERIPSDEEIAQIVGNVLEP